MRFGMSTIERIGNAMTEYDITKKSHPVIVSEYAPQWAAEFTNLARRIRGLVGSAAIRIDHIGSTSVPELAAKDIIDLQITVADLDRVEGVTVPLRDAGFRRGDEFVYDEFWTMATTDPQLRKLYMREPEGERRAHIHIREIDRFNQRYALLFRDYLRASGVVRKGYEEVKRRAARLFPDSIDGYLFLKDPVFHIIYEAACLWASAIGWAPDDEYL
jgi:GrpB-like predicted nucleotidyltransferase (UPF0157 family)